MWNVQYLTNLKASALKFKIFLPFVKRFEIKRKKQILRMITIDILVISFMFYGKIVC